MAHVGEERGFGAIEVGEGFGALSLLLESMGVGKRSGDMAGDEGKKAQVIFVERPAGAYAGDERADVASAGLEGQNDGLFCRARRDETALCRPRL